ncbi:DUF3313 domain-containing protein [Sphingomonas sp. DG1-23]|uniref:DUF3313 domain-containing protein n=1 Tax=Sphingomonas sp. DG1-23 TaxID=3068316 RepID=UPI0027401A1D|nr:DUF3313 domain-containing protein [Sphingomonas sp. DG1-23]MDP5278728.1 DUF3313 domain-containing protein [Sphingomonas sp. DG1-23]
MLDYPLAGDLSVRAIIHPRRTVRSFVACLALSSLAACATPPMTRSGALTSYDHLVRKKGRTTQSQARVNKQDLLAARTVRILPARFADGVGTDVAEKNRNLVANALDRSLCRKLSKRFDIVEATEPADLSVRTTITHIGTTSRIAAGASAIVGFIPSALSSIPLLNPRVPVGLGSLTVEAEALDRNGEQDAALIWARGADSILSTARVSEVGDAYAQAGEFGDKFSEMLITGETSRGGLKLPRLPKFGGSKKDGDCGIFGSDPGLLGKVSENLALPPATVDKGAKRKKETPPDQ